jgi:hypothetical protein
MMSWVLLVEPDGAVRERLRHVAGRFGHVDGDAEFRVAREHLLSNPYDRVVTNTRLAAYNGLHLMHLGAAARAACSLCGVRRSGPAPSTKLATGFIAP